MTDKFEEPRPDEPGPDAEGGDRAEHEQLVPAEGAEPTEEAFEIPDDASALLDAQSGAQAPVEEVPRQTSEVDRLTSLVSERTADLQRLKAEYVNYKRRVDRDRDVAKERGIESVVLDLLPILDSVHAARLHDELTGGVKLIVDELEKLTAKYGLEVYGEVGEPFDPNVHEALMQVPFEGPYDVTVVSAVMQKGIKLHDRVLRPARVGVAEPA